jgi:hypothetical protein
MEALHSYHVDQRRPARRPRVKVLPDFANLDPFKPKPSRTNPNVMFKRPSSMSSLMYWRRRKIINVTVAVLIFSFLVNLSKKSKTEMCNEFNYDYN